MYLSLDEVDEMINKLEPQDSRGPAILSLDRLAASGKATVPR